MVSAEGCWGANGVCVSSAGSEKPHSGKNMLVTQNHIFLKSTEYHHNEKVLIIISLCVAAEGGGCYIRLCWPQHRQALQETQSPQRQRLWILHSSAPGSSPSRFCSLHCQWRRGRLWTHGVTCARSPHGGTWEINDTIVASELAGFSVKIPSTKKKNKMERMVVMTTVVCVDKVCRQHQFLMILFICLMDVYGMLDRLILFHLIVACRMFLQTCPTKGGICVL